jgi:hypothetical protein
VNEFIKVAGEEDDVDLTESTLNDPGDDDSGELVEDEDISDEEMEASDDVVEDEDFGDDLAD